MTASVLLDVIPDNKQEAYAAWKGQPNRDLDAGVRLHERGRVDGDTALGFAENGNCAAIRRAQNKASNNAKPASRITTMSNFMIYQLCGPHL